MRGRAATTLLFVLLGVYAVLAIATARSKSATFDEVKHVPAGYMFLRYGDYRLDLDNPPLARIVAAVPLLGAGVRVDTTDPTWREARVWRFGHLFLYQWNDADRLLFLSRAAITVVALLLLVTLFLWTRRHWGDGPACLALLLGAFNPDLLAHGSLATTDLVASALFFVTIVAFERLLDRVTAWRVVATGVALGCALTAKYSAVTLLPILATLAAVEAWRLRPIAIAWTASGPARATAETRRRRFELVAATLVAVGLVAGATIWDVYRWRFAPTPGADPAPALEWDRTAAEQGTVGSVVRTARDLHLLPEAYLHGFLDMLRSGRAHRSFVMGAQTTGGVWYYFPLTLALKTPPGLMLLAAAGVALFFVPALRTRVDPFLYLPPLVYFILAVAHGLNIGQRHLLPIVPFILIMAGRSMTWAGRLTPAGSTASGAPALPAAPVRLPLAARRGLVGLAAGSCLLGAIANHPDHLAYFNILAGGPSQGWRYLVDSNLDWGQDLKGLAAWLRAHPGPRLKLSYFGAADPRYYGIDADYLPSEMRPMPDRVVTTVLRGDRVAVSATNLQSLYLEPGAKPLMEILKTKRPIATIGHSIFIYDADFDWAMDR
ncbi:MAG TPA: hypothetical protein VJV75_10505 [Candidatus Polarisedimenticolia bacterium]|nr:hypothetical protein [Candidatus Polarisedimenticolia bacterium]